MIPTPWRCLDLGFHYPTQHTTLMPDPDLSPVSREIRARYRGAKRGRRETVHRGRYGWYTRHLDDPSLDSVIVGPISEGQIPDLLEEVRQQYGAGPARVYVDDRNLNCALNKAMVASGCRPSCELIYLAHLGKPPQIESVPELSVEHVTGDNIRDYEIVRMKGFSDSEDDPDQSEVAANVDALTADLGEGCELIVARVGQEAAAIAGWYEGQDRLVFHLATRVPFRNRGIARHLLSRVTCETYAQGRRSVTIFTDPEDTPIHFYRRLGFTGEVYWQARYVYEPA